MYFELESEFNSAILLRVLILYYTVHALFLLDTFPFHFKHELNLNCEISILLCLLLCFIHFTKLTTDQRIQSTFNVKTFCKCIHL